MAGQVKRLSIGWAIFGAAAVVSAAVILVSARDTVFSGDELGILFRLAYEPLGTALFEPPPEKYLIAVPTLLYGGLAETVGAGSYLAYRLLGIALVVLAAGLFFALARRRAPLALALGVRDRAALLRRRLRGALDPPPGSRARWPSAPGSGALPGARPGRSEGGT